MEPAEDSLKLTMRLYRLILATIFQRKAWALCAFAALVIPFTLPLISSASEKPILLQPARIQASWGTLWICSLLWGLFTAAREGENNAFAPVHDLFSAMLFVRSQKLEKGDNITLVAQPFATPYLIRIHVVDHVLHKQQPAIHLRLAMNKINRDTLQLDPYKKMNREASLWLSNDKQRIPLELRASVFIGDVRATLTNARR